VGIKLSNIQDCINAVLVIEDDGMMNCPYLESGFQTCEVCYRQLEIKQWKKENYITSKDESFYGYARRGDHPRQLCTIWEIRKDKKHIFEINSEYLYYSLFEALADGWRVCDR
jgi:hypothetical protein